MPVVYAGVAERRIRCAEMLPPGAYQVRRKDGETRNKEMPYMPPEMAGVP